MGENLKAEGTVRANNNETGSLQEVLGHVLSRLSSLQSDKNDVLNTIRLEVEKLTSQFRSENENLARSLTEKIILGKKFWQ
jgi:hypothetical protein